jgi:Tfp pilus assembly protein PilV
MGPRPRRCAGLTLVEFLFATSVMALAALGVVGMFPSALKTVVAGGNVTKAAVLATAAMEMLRAEKFDDLVSQYNGFDSNASITGYTCPVPVAGGTAYNKMRLKCEVSPDAAQETGRGLPDGRLSISVACVNSSGEATSCPGTFPDLRRVSVTVSWERSGARTVQIQSYVARQE